MHAANEVPGGVYRLGQPEIREARQLSFGFLLVGSQLLQAYLEGVRAHTVTPL
ncbi:hypothetical protein LRS06_24990 [Hymenobacter sp. J193]|uniref:hypothetical protein n=1 Tax=Hymenobacter sp. J193 TaxID=2898429 RepID=UPI00215137C6|nr:hypothetical protein [Hymenobacter sp. J193]MCR5890898.1 hypothetical protein [Hymenobacter sp. J193]MCR5890983.1 hypothetical protein [Hymenobacter sp. J193]